MLYDLIHAMHSGFLDLTKQCADDVRQRFERTAKEAAAKRLRSINRLASSTSAFAGRSLQSQFLNMKLVCGLEKVSAVVRLDDSTLLHSVCVPGAINFAWLEKILRKIHKVNTILYTYFFFSSWIGTKLWSLNSANERGQSPLHVAVARLPEFSLAHDITALQQDQARIALLLLELGASVTSVDSNVTRRRSLDKLLMFPSS